MSSDEALKSLKWVPLVGRRLRHRCAAVRKAIIGDIPKHLQCFRLPSANSHGYSTRNGYLPRLERLKTECLKRTTYFKCVNDWKSLPDSLKKPMPLNIFNKILDSFLLDKL